MVPSCTPLSKRTQYRFHSKPFFSMIVPAVPSGTSRSSTVLRTLAPLLSSGRVAVAAMATSWPVTAVHRHSEPSVEIISFP